MMNAEVTAENRPACGLIQHPEVQLEKKCKTHEYQRRVQILLISIHEFLVVLLSHLAVVSVESRAGVLRCVALPRVV